MEFLRAQTSIDFLGRRRSAVLISGLLIVISIVSIAVRGLNFGIDFTGGTLVEVAYSEPVAVEDVRAALNSAQIENALVQHFGTASDVMIRLPVTTDDTAQLSSTVVAALRSPFGESLDETRPGQVQQCVVASGVTEDCHVQMRRVEFVGPQVGDELTEQGTLAMLYALLGILIYVAWRFEWRFALGSVAALIHDVVITVGAFSIMQLEFSLAVLAALLAVIGYSLNDTIVVFDRIRENFRKMRKGSAVSIMNASLNQTLRRTILTSVTTLLVVLTLLLVGGEVIRGFAAALIIGVLVGTYSSIFVASPTVLVLGITREDMMTVKKEGEDLETSP